jgi:hypothetical protein
MFTELTGLQVEHEKSHAKGIGLGAELRKTVLGWIETV